MVELKDINMESLPEFIYKGDLDQAFANTLKQIQVEIGLKPVVSKINIIFDGKDTILPEDNELVIDLGVRRIQEDGVLTLILDEKYKDYFPYILLREAFYCFIPPKTRELRNVKIAINLLVESKLSNLKN